MDTKKPQNLIHAWLMVVGLAEYLDAPYSHQRVAMHAHAVGMINKALNTNYRPGRMEEWVRGRRPTPKSVKRWIGTHYLKEIADLAGVQLYDGSIKQLAQILFSD